MVPVLSRFRLVAAMICVVFFSGCIFSTDKKDNGEQYPPGTPAITWLSISDGTVLKTRSFTVSWKGNEYSLRYRFTLDDISSAWFDSTSYTVSFLADGPHVLSVQAANDSLFSDITPVHFTVDAGVKSGISFFPDTVSSISFVSVFLNDVTGIMAAHIEITCADSCASLRDFFKSASASAGNVVLFTDSRDPYRLILDIGFPEKNGGLKGTLELGSFVISPIKKGGIISIDPLKTVFRDTQNQAITLGQYGTLRIQP